MGKIIDVSHHQGDIDWSKASKDVDLAIIRTQYGTRTIDPKYQTVVKSTRCHTVYTSM